MTHAAILASRRSELDAFLYASVGENEIGLVEHLQHRWLKAADVIALPVDFSGEVQATVKVAELLTLKETARFSGDITTGKLAIEPGAKFSGTCMMEIPVKTDSKANGNEPSR